MNKRKWFILAISAVIVIIISGGVVFWLLCCRAPSYVERGEVFYYVMHTLSKGGPVLDDIIKRGLYTRNEQDGRFSGEVKIGEIKKLVDEGVYALDHEQHVLIFGPNYRPPETTPVPPAPTTPDPLEGITLSSECIVVGEVMGITYELVGRSPYTIYKVSVEKVINGTPDTKEVFFKLWGGPLADGGWGELVGQDSYREGDRILAFLSNESNGIFKDVEVHWVWGDVIKSDPELEVVICRVIKIMETHNLPVSLPPGEIDCSKYPPKVYAPPKPRLRA